MNITRRKCLAIGIGAWVGTTARTREPVDEVTPIRRNPIAVSTYSFWQFRHNKLRDVEKCIDLAADMGFDGVELLHRQMQDESNDYLQRLKRDRKSTRLNSSHIQKSRMPSSA